MPDQEELYAHYVAEVRAAQKLNVFVRRNWRRDWVAAGTTANDQLLRARAIASVEPNVDPLDFNLDLGALVRWIGGFLTFTPSAPKPLPVSTEEEQSQLRARQARAFATTLAGMRQAKRGQQEPTAEEWLAAVNEVHSRSGGIATVLAAPTTPPAATPEMVAVANMANLAEAVWYQRFGKGTKPEGKAWADHVVWTIDIMLKAAENQGDIGGRTRQDYEREWAAHGDLRKNGNDLVPSEEFVAAFTKTVTEVYGRSILPWKATPEEAATFRTASGIDAVTTPPLPSESKAQEDAGPIVQLLLAKYPELGGMNVQALTADVVLLLSGNLNHDQAAAKWQTSDGHSPLAEFFNWRTRNGRVTPDGDVAEAEFYAALRTLGPLISEQALAEMATARGRAAVLTQYRLATDGSDFLTQPTFGDWLVRHGAEIADGYDLKLNAKAASDTAILATLPESMRGLVAMGLDPETAVSLGKVLVRGPEESFASYALRATGTARDITDSVVSLAATLRPLVPGKRVPLPVDTAQQRPVVAEPTTIDTFRYMVDQGIIDPQFGLLFHWAETLPANDVVGQVARRAITEDSPEALRAGLQAVAARYSQLVKAPAPEGFVTPEAEFSAALTRQYQSLLSDLPAATQSGLMSQLPSIGNTLWQQFLAENPEDTGFDVQGLQQSGIDNAVAARMTQAGYPTTPDDIKAYKAGTQTWEPAKVQQFMAAGSLAVGGSYTPPGADVNATGELSLYQPYPKELVSGAYPTSPFTDAAALQKLKRNRRKQQIEEFIGKQTRETLFGAPTNAPAKLPTPTFTIGRT